MNGFLRTEKKTFSTFFNFFLIIFFCQQINRIELRNVHSTQTINLPGRSISVLFVVQALAIILGHQIDRICLIFCLLLFIKLTHSPRSYQNNLIVINRFDINLVRHFFFFLRPLW